MIPGDSKFRLVELLLHADGSDNGTAFTNVVAKHTLTRSGQVVTKTGTKKFGTASFYFDGASDYLVTSGTVDLTGSFCIEFWLNLQDMAANHGLFYSGDLTDNNRVQGTVLATGEITFYARTTSQDPNFDITTSAGAVTSNTWYHVAFVKNGSTAKIYLDGAEAASGAVTGTMPSGYALRLGQSRTGSADRWLKGYLDEVRATIGDPRYTAAFTAPTDVFPDHGTSIDTGNREIAGVCAIPRRVALQSNRRARVMAGGQEIATHSRLLGTISGTITEDVPFARWTVVAHDAVTGAYLSSQTTATGAYSLQVPLNVPVMVTCRAAFDYRWLNNNQAVAGDLMVPRNPGATPYVYRCTTGGVSGGAEPTWGTTPGGTTNDGTAVWTCLARLPKPITHGPLVAT